MWDRQLFSLQRGAYHEPVPWSGLAAWFSGTIMYSKIVVGLKRMRGGLGPGLVFGF